MLDQASELRELVQRKKDAERGEQDAKQDQKSLATVLSVTSGKGGVGKSNVAVNLAIQLSRLDQKVILLDMDLGLANIDILLDINPRYNLSHVIRNEIQLTEGIVPAEGGIFVIPGVSGEEDLADLRPQTRESLLKTLFSLQRLADVLIVDTGAGISNNVIPFAACADQVLTVTTPEPTAMIDAYAAIKRLSTHSECGDLRVVVNKADSREEAFETAEGVENVAQRFLDVPVEKLGFIMRDEKVSDAVRQKKPFSLLYPDAPASKCMHTIAKILTGASDQNLHSSGFLNRFMSWLLP